MNPTAEQFKREHPLDVFLTGLGARLHGQGAQKTTNICARQTHKPGHLCVTVDLDKQLWNCNDCHQGGDVIRWMALATGKSDGEVLKNRSVPCPAPKPAVVGEPPKYTTVATYDYVTACGDLVYQVVRQQAPNPEPGKPYLKTFKQRRPDANGGWIYNMDGVERVLYRLPEVLKAKTVWIVEGEKDADTLASLGFAATCNVGGAGKWMDAYNSALDKKHVAICGDNDKPGQAHAEQVFQSLAGRAKSVRKIKLPGHVKDVTDFVSDIKDPAQVSPALYALLDAAIPFVKGVSLPIYRLAELEEMYSRHVADLERNSFDLGRWLPSLRKLRSLVVGEVVLILAATGVGKTAALSNLAVASHPLPTLLFELELPAEAMYERLIALQTKMACRAVEQAYKTGDTLGEAAVDNKFSHLHICTESRLTVEKIEELIIRSELKIGVRPKLVLLDYVGLVQGPGKSRYEKISTVAESLKVVAKTTRTIIIMASQVARAATNESPEITLGSGKDSGSLENSAGLVIGIWRNQREAGLMHMKILKATRGGAGMEIFCNYNTETLAITERAIL